MRKSPNGVRTGLARSARRTRWIAPVSCSRNCRPCWGVRTCGSDAGGRQSPRPEPLKDGPRSFVAVPCESIKSRLELESDTDASVERGLELRRIAAQDRADRLAEIRIGRAGVDLRVLIVVTHAALVEQVEHVGHEHHPA